MMALISEVTDKETGIHPGHFAKSKLACVDELSGAITQVNIDQLTLKMSDMHHGFVSAGFQADFHRLPPDFLHFLFTFFTLLTLGVLFVGSAPIGFKVKHRAKNMLIWFNISYLAVYPVKG